MQIVVALGGNALLRRGEPMTADNQRKNAALAAKALVGLARQHELIITHGNGPKSACWLCNRRPIRRCSPTPSMCWELSRRA